MPNVIDFLERMGQDARLHHASQEDLELALSQARIEPSLSMTMLAGDPSKLQVLLGQKPHVAVQFPGKDDEEEDEDEGEGGQEAPSARSSETWIPPSSRYAATTVS